MTHQAHKLGEICQVLTGGTPSRTKLEYFGGGIPWVKITDMLQGIVISTDESLTDAGITNSSAKLMPFGTVLISIFATIGRTAVLGIEAATNQAIAGVVPKDKAQLDSQYLRYFLDSQHGELNRVARGVAQPNINQAILKNLDVPLPPLAEQARIVDILSRAEGIVRLRREAEKKAAELIPALFLDMFGDPATNPKGWPIRKVSDFVSKFEGGKNIQAGSENGSPYRILKVSAVTSGVYRENESKPSPDDYSPPVSHIVRAGDMLFSRANTEQLVGATAIVERTDGKTLLPDKLWRFIWNEPVEPAYMHALFQSNDVRRELGKLSSGTSASMRNISQGKLYQLPLPIAPNQLQKDFAERSDMINSIQSEQAAATATAQATFDALLAGCFDQGIKPCPT